MIQGIHRVHAPARPAACGPGLYAASSAHGSPGAVARRAHIRNPHIYNHFDLEKATPHPHIAFRTLALPWIAVNSIKLINFVIQYAPCADE